VTASSGNRVDFALKLIGAILVLSGLVVTLQLFHLQTDIALETAEHNTNLEMLRHSIEIRGSMSPTSDQLTTALIEYENANWQVRIHELLKHGNSYTHAFFHRTFEEPDERELKKLKSYAAFRKAEAKRLFGIALDKDIRDAPDSEMTVARAARLVKSGILLGEYKCAEMAVADIVRRSSGKVKNDTVRRVFETWPSKQDCSEISK